MRTVWNQQFCAPDNTQAFLGGTEGTEPFAIGISIINNEDEQDATDQEIPVQVGLPPWPISYGKLRDVYQSQRAIIDETQHNHTRQHRHPTGLLYISEVFSMNDEPNSE